MPKASNSANITKPDHIEARKQQQPELHIRADRHTQDETVAQVMSAAEKLGLVRIGFVTDPSR